MTLSQVRKALNYYKKREGKYASDIKNHYNKMKIESLEKIHRELYTRRTVGVIRKDIDE